MSRVTSSLDIVWVLNTNGAVLHFVDWGVTRLPRGHVKEDVVADDVDHNDLT